MPHINNSDFVWWMTRGLAWLPAMIIWSWLAVHWYRRLRLQQKMSMLFASGAHLAGRKRWQKFRKHWVQSNFSEEHPKARERAYLVVQKLAPEAHYDRYMKTLSSAYLCATPGSMNGECCSNTFCSVRDNGIPDIERALNIYLWKKLYPRRYRGRRTTTGWGAGTPRVLDS